MGSALTTQNSISDFAEESEMADLDTFGHIKTHLDSFGHSPFAIRSLIVHAFSTASSGIGRDFIGTAPGFPEQAPTKSRPGSEPVPTEYWRRELCLVLKKLYSG